MLDKERIARIAKIKNAVIENFDAGDWQTLATFLGDDGRIITAHDRLLRSLNWSDPDYPSCAATVLGQLVQRDETVLDLVEGMLDEKDLGIGEVSHDSLDTIFPSPQKVESLLDTSLATAMMPFSPSFDEVKDALRTACTNTGLELKAADDIWENSILIKDIVGLISKACIVIVDFTGKNPNVMYETGIAHALHKEVVPIAQSIDDVPFDLRHHRIFIYNNNPEGRENLQQEIESRIKTIQKNHGWQPLFL